MEEGIRDFDLLFNEYSQKVYSLAYRLMGNKEDAMDISQEAFINIFRKLNSFKGESDIATWIYRVVYNTCIDELRKKKIKQVPIHDNCGLQDDVSVEDRLEISIRKKAVRDALYKLEPEQRSIIVLRDMQGLSYDDIAFIMKCPLGTVKSRLSRARLKLKEILENDSELFRDASV